VLLESEGIFKERKRKRRVWVRVQSWRWGGLGWDELVLLRVKYWN
jgi:hypothetical protein